MDERILVEVYVPAVQQGMEVLLPAQANLGVVHCFVSRLLETAWHLEKGSLKDAIWYLEQQDSMPDFALCVKDAGIRNAERIIIL